MTEPAEPTDRRPLASRSYAWVQGLAKTLAAKGIKPNQISLAGVGLAIIAFVALWGAGRGWPFYSFWLLIAVGCIQGRLLCNLLDGLVAVEGGLKSKGGDLFNEIPDRIEDTLFFAGAGLACGCGHVGWLCAVLAVFTAYVRAFGASLGQGQDFGGPCAKQQRLFLLSAGLLLGAVFSMLHISFNVLEWMLWLIVLGTAATAALRIQRMYQKAP
jgi:phosphatidylglycerophosphate synthase